MSIVSKQALEYLVSTDPIFKRIIDSYGIPPDWSRPRGFETLCRIILEQQVSLDSGKATYEKLHSLIDEFSPENIRQLSIQEMRVATVSRQKASYLIALSESILNGELDLHSFGSMSTIAQMTQLQKIKGIGPWTAQVYLLFAMGEPDIYPRGDIALINTIKELWSASSSEDAENISRRWSPHRSAASFLLWHYYLSKRGRSSPN